jgi:hypothetical protein
MAGLKKIKIWKFYVLENLGLASKVADTPNYNKSPKITQKIENRSILRQERPEYLIEG